MTSKEFKQKIPNLAKPELKVQIEKLLSDYGLKNVQVKGLSISPNFEITDKQECLEAGGKWVYRTYPDGTVRCRCIKSN